MGSKTIPIFQSESDRANYERKTPLTKLLIDELWRYRDEDLAWCATLDEFYSDDSNRCLIADGFTPVLSNLKDAEEVYAMLAYKEYLRLSTLRRISFSQSASSGTAKSTPVVAVSYKHMRCTAEGKEHIKISRRKFLDIFYRISQFFQGSVCRSISNPMERLEPRGVILWLDRMLLVSEIPSSTTAWVDRGLAPYMATMFFLSCVTSPEADVDHYDPTMREIDVSFGGSEDFRVGDVLSSLWIAVEFDLSYGATAVISSADSLVWTNVMYSLPDIDSMDQGLQTQVRNMLARSRCSISVSGYSFSDTMLREHTEDTRKIKLLDDEIPRPVVALGSPTKMRGYTDEASFSQLRQDLMLCASLMPLMAGDHNFSRISYSEDVATMKRRWSRALERILATLDQSQIAYRRRTLIDLFAAREFDHRCKGLDHTASTESLACLGYLHLVEESSCWKHYFTGKLVDLLKASYNDDARFIGILHCRCFRHNLSPQLISDRCVYVSINIFGSVVYPHRAVYNCHFFSRNGDGSRVRTTIATGRCSTALRMMFRELVNDAQERKFSLSKGFVVARDLSSLLVLHGRIIRFLLDYGCQDHAIELCSNPSDWTYAQVLEGCRTFRATLTKLLLHSLNWEVLHTSRCQAKKASLQKSDEKTTQETVTMHT